MLGKRIINTATGAAPSSCTTDTVQILDGVPFQSIATYELDGNANDLTTNYDGTASNVTYSTGKFGQAAEFDGSSSTVATNAKIPFSLDFSFSFWFNTTSSYASGYLFSTKENYQTNGYYVLINNGQIQYGEGDGTNNATTQYSTTTNLNDGNWHHCVVTRAAGGTLSMYIDNIIEVNNASLGTGYMTSDNWHNNLRIGRYSGVHPSGLYYDGKLDQVRIYDKALSAAHVTTLYNETAATASTNITLEVPSLVAYYKMNDATDETGSYDGTPTNVNFNVAGKFGNAGEFNGSSSYMTTSLKSQNVGAYSFWFKGSAPAAAATLFNTNNVSSANKGVMIQGQTNGTIRVYISQGNGTAALDVYTTNTFFDNNWHNAVLIWDLNSSGTNTYLYIDNVVAAEGAANTGVWTSGQDSAYGLFIGAGRTSLQFFNGSIDQIRVFDRAITANEVTTLYNEVYCVPTIVPTDHFEPVIYTGNGTTQSISTLDFQPDWVWVKNRDSAGENHLLSDVVSGFGKILFSNLTNAQIGSDNTYFSQLSNGFSINTNNGNVNTNNYVSWNWRAGGAAVTNTDGTITSQVSANTDAGFSVVKFTGNTEVTPTVGHGLNSEPEIYFLKGLDNGTDSWIVGGNRTIFSSPSTNFLRLNTNNFVGSTGSNAVGSNGNVINIGVRNYNTQDTIAYCFHSVDGMSKIGSYVGTGSGNTVNVVTGFRPAMIIIKRTDSIEDWKIIDNKRDFANSLEPNESIAEEVGNNSNFSSHSNGFTIGDPHGDYNANGGTYIFMAFAEEVFVPDNFFNDDSTLATYKLNGDAGDDSGNGNNGTASNVTYATGKFDDAAVFNGSSSVINLSSSPLDITTDFTISGWLNHESTGVNLFLFACTDTNTNDIHFDLNLQSTQNRVELVYNNVAYYIPLTYQSGWHHYALRLSGSSLQIYRNGSLFNTQTVTVASTSGNRQTIGTRLRQNYSSYGSGYIDQVRIFNRALDAGEVTQLYNE